MILNNEILNIIKFIKLFKNINIIKKFKYKPHFIKLNNLYIYEYYVNINDLLSFLIFRKYIIKIFYNITNILYIKICNE